ncbi:retrovirus-related pol polyprotein from transposon TNT 1-94 [Tanacetum coccineum]
MEKEKSVENNEVIDKNVVESSELDVVEPIELVDRKEGMEDETDDESDESMKEELIEWETKAEVLVEMPRIAKDVLTDVAGHVYPMDFVILDIKEDENNPFILGTPFLTTAKAEIKFDKGTITLKFGKNKISFFKIPEFPYKIKDKPKENIDSIKPTNIMSRRILEREERIKYRQEKEMGFNQ